MTTSNRRRSRLPSSLWRSLLPVFLVLVLVGNLTGVAAAYEPPHDEPGPAADRLYFRQFDVDRAPLDLEAGEMDLYYFSLKIAAARALRDQEDIQIFEAPATTLALVLNPAPAPDGQLNPFSIKEVRQAMQRLVDREFVAREIYLGQAMPMLTHVSPTDFDYLTIYDIVWDMDLRYDPEFAREQIREAMEDAGAELVDDIWHYNDEPVRLKFVIRVEDERRELGDLVRAALSDAGFLVEPIYQPFAPALQAVYATDPAQMGWHLYTEGWGRGAPQRYDFGTINQMTAPWLGNLPGWREVGFWQYEHEELDDLGQRLFRGEFGDRSERNEIYREMTQLGLEESVRIWVTTVMSAFPARANLQGITEDLAAGPRSIWSLREAHMPDAEELTVGHAWVWTERTTWNPIGGLGDVYSVDIWRNLHDPPMWNHPFTGIPGPFRVDYDVESAGPDDKLVVPEDAVMWDVERKEWRSIGSNVEATSRVVFDYSRYFQAPWHHGQPISMADVVYSIYQSFDMAYDPNKARIETAMAVTARPYLETIRGYRVLDDERIEVYVDFWHFDENYIASYASPAGLSMPWELMYAMDVVVFEQRRAAYSDTAAARFNVPWLSLVMERHAREVRRALLELANDEVFPENVFAVPMNGEDNNGLTDLDTALSRYRAVLDWFDENEHMIISNGPFIMTRYDPPAQFAQLDAFRDPAYPFRPGDHFKGQPEVIEFARVEAQPIGLGEEAEINISLSGPGALAVRYLLVDAATGEIVHQGEAEPVTDTDFVVHLDAELTSALDIGLYELSLAAYSDALARMTERRVELEADIAVAEPAEPVEEEPVEEEPPVVEEPVEEEPVVEEEPEVEPEEPPVVEEPAPTPEPGAPVGAIAAVVIIVAIIGAGAFMFWRRRSTGEEEGQP